MVAAPALNGTAPSPLEARSDAPLAAVSKQLIVFDFDWYVPGFEDQTRSALHPCRALSASHVDELKLNPMVAVRTSSAVA